MDDRRAIMYEPPRIRALTHRLVDQGNIMRAFRPVDSAIDQGDSFPVLGLCTGHEHMRATRRTHPRHRRLPDVPPPHEPFVTPARPAGLGLRGSSNGSGVP